jgi:hypothetical protein
VSRMCERKVQRRVDCAGAKERSEEEDSLHGILTISRLRGLSGPAARDRYKTGTRPAGKQYESESPPAVCRGAGHR